MNRDAAIALARRIMDRVELDGAMHLDAIADEIVREVRAPPLSVNCTSLPEPQIDCGHLSAINANLITPKDWNKELDL